MSNSDATYDAFFYGTLMHPKILTRVINNGGAHLKICPALLLEHTRHKVKYADYPGVIPYHQSKSAFGHDLSEEDSSVRGTLVLGLTRGDVARLDLFEGSEYTRRSVFVYKLDEPISLSSYAPSDGGAHQPLIPSIAPPFPSIPELNSQGFPLSVQTYIFLPLDRLESSLWSFEQFVKQNAWKWYGGAAPLADEFEDQSCSVESEEGNKEEENKIKKTIIEQRLERGLEGRRSNEE